MNYSMIRYILSSVICFEGIFLLLPAAPARLAVPVLLPEHPPELHRLLRAAAVLLPPALPRRPAAHPALHPTELQAPLTARAAVRLTARLAAPVRLLRPRTVPALRQVLLLRTAPAVRLLLRQVLPAAAALRPARLTLLLRKQRPAANPPIRKALLPHPDKTHLCPPCRIGWREGRRLHVLGRTACSGPAGRGGCDRR